MPLFRALVADNHEVDGRLTLASATPIPATDQTGKTTVYFTPYKGNRISLFNGTVWTTRSFSEISVAVPSTLFRLFDLFVYDNGGTMTLEAVNWNQSTGSITNATAAAPSVVTSNAHGLSNGNYVAIGGITGTLGTSATNGLNGTVWKVANVAANTFECEGSDTSGLTYTSGGTWYTVPNTRATALATQDGVYVQTGATNKRYVGTGMTTSTSGQCEDSQTKRYIWNYYNRVPRPFRLVEATSSWTYSTSTLRPANNSKANRLELVNVDIGDMLEISIWVKFSSDVAANGYAEFGHDSMTTGTGLVVPNHAVTNAGSYANIAVNYRHVFAETGYHFFQWLEKGHGSGTQTFYGESSAGIIASSLA